MNDLIQIAIWVLIIGGTFAYLWRKGHLMHLATYVKETREELRKCTWPSVDELKGSTIVVMVATVLLGVFIICTDFVILKFVRGILPKL